jgi:hypothetical protein
MPAGVGNSSIKLQEIVDDANSYADLAPSLAAAGYSDAPALSIANDTLSAMLLGGENGQPLNWKWNRMNLPTFLTNSWQQDYFIPGLVNLAWGEYCWAININSTVTPKQKLDLEWRRDLQVTYLQTGFPGKICWMPNNLLQTGTWGKTNQQTPTGQTNPGPGVVITDPIALGTISMPANPTTCLSDAFGNLWVLTQYGTCGNVNPFLTNLNPVFPTFTAPTTVATVVNDGTVQWTAINPIGQGIRLSPVPPQTGVLWQINAVGQMRQAKFLSLGQTLDPIPDDYSTYFKQGFFAQCHRRSSDPKVRAKFEQEWALWLKALNNAIKSGQREQDDMGFYPTSGVMDTGWGVWNYPNPAQPYGPWGY